MKSSPQIYDLLKKIEAYAADLGGVFSAADLANLIGARSKLAAARIINRCVKGGFLTRVQRGIYVTSAFDLQRLAMRLAPDCYISMDSALARHGLIGTVPERSVSAIHVGRRRRISTDQGMLFIYSIAPEMYFGFESAEFGVRMADPEKAFIDLLYFYTKAARFVIDPLSEVAVDKLDKRKVERYLRRYNNPRFIAFVKGLLHEKP